MTDMEDPAPTAKRSLFRILLFSPDEPRLRSAWRLLGQLILLLLSIAILGGFSNLLFSALDDFFYTGFLLIIALITAVGITISIFVARRYLDHRSFRSLGLNINRQTVSDLFFGFVLTGLMIGMIYLLEWAADWLTVESLAWQSERLDTFILSIIVMLSLFALVSWQEELLLRGYWLQNLSDGLNLSLGVLLSSALFALGHSLNPNMSWQALLGLFLSGLFLAYAYIRTRQLWLPIGLHLGWNFFEGTIFGFPVSGQYFYQVIRQTVTGPDLITGGAFGPEAGLILVPALLFGVAGLYWYTKDRLPVNQTSTGET